jgi:hypothetical protein
MDEDVATQVGAALSFGNGPIISVWIVNPKGEVVAAVGIERREAIDAFRDLKVALSELWAGPAARGKHWIA